MPNLVLIVGMDDYGLAEAIAFCKSNRVKLGQEGFYLPTAWDSVDGLWLPSLLESGLIDAWKSGDKNIAFLPALADECYAEMITDLGFQLRENSDKTWVVFASTLIHQPLGDKESVRLFCGFLDSLFSEARIVFLSGDPVCTALSMWSASIQSGRCWAQMPSPRDARIDYVCNYDIVVENWKSECSRSRVEFIRSGWIAGRRVSPVRQLFGSLGVAPSALAEPVEILFPSDRALSVLLEINARLYSDTAPIRVYDRARSVLNSRVLAGCHGERLAPSLKDIVAYEQCYGSCPLGRGDASAYSAVSDRSLPSSVHNFSDRGHHDATSLPVLTRGELEIIDMIYEAWSDSFSHCSDLSNSLKRARESGRLAKRQFVLLNSRLQHREFELESLFLRVKGVNQGGKPRASPRTVVSLAWAKIYRVISRVAKLD